MNQQKIDRMESGINAMARKVLECCPIQEPWTKEQIATEMRRSGSGAQVPVIQGCLDTLRGMGLIKEPERGKFVRITAKPKQEAIPTPILKVVQPMSPQKQPVQSNDPISRMAELADQARAIAKEIESVALEMEERIERVNKEAETLRQLQTLLKSLN